MIQGRGLNLKSEEYIFLRPSGAERAWCPDEVGTSEAKAKRASTLGERAGRRKYIPSDYYGVELNLILEKI